MGLNFEFNGCVAPDIFGVEYVYLGARFDRGNHFMLVQPFLVILNLVTQPGTVILTLCNNNDSLVNDLRLLQDPLSDIFSTVGALFASHKTLTDALFAETVPTDRCLTRNYQVHTN